jgi:hypothetical protein
MMIDDAYYCLPYFEPHALFRDFLLAHPDADVMWITAADGTSDVLMDERTERCFRRWHRALQETAITPLRGSLWLEGLLGPSAGPPVP